MTAALAKEAMKDSVQAAESVQQTRAHMVVVGNEKGGAGKSTVAIHLAIALLRMGWRVAAVDLDVRQRSFDRYLENRSLWMQHAGIALPMPLTPRIDASPARHLDEAERVETERWTALRAELDQTCDMIVVDTPGGATHLSRLAHAAADTIVTPVNDSFIDFDLLASVDPATFEVKRPSIYSEMVWQSRMRKTAQEKKPVDWLVMRNRMSSLDARNKRRVGDGLETLSKKIGFRLAPGFSERVIYRELFPKGLTLLDLTDQDSVQLTMSHVAARQELRELVNALKLPGFETRTLPF